jgi:hypothetical protein
MAATAAAAKKKKNDGEREKVAQEMNQLYSDAIALVAEAQPKKSASVMEQVEEIVNAIPRIPQGQIKTLPAEESSDEDKQEKKKDGEGEDDDLTDDPLVVKGTDLTDEEEEKQDQAVKKQRLETEQPVRESIDLTDEGEKNPPSDNQRKGKKVIPRIPTPMSMEYADQEGLDDKNEEKKADDRLPVKRKLDYTDVESKDTPSDPIFDDTDELDKSSVDVDRKAGAEKKTVKARRTVSRLPLVSPNSSGAMITPIRPTARVNKVAPRRYRPGWKEHIPEKDSADEEEDVDTDDEYQPDKEDDDDDDDEEKEENDEDDDDNYCNELGDLSDCLESTDDEERDDPEKFSTPFYAVDGMRHSIQRAFTIAAGRTPSAHESKNALLQPAVRKSGPAPTYMVKFPPGSKTDRCRVFYNTSGMPMIRLDNQGVPVCVPLYNYELHLLRLGLQDIAHTSYWVKLHCPLNALANNQLCMTCASPTCLFYGHSLTGVCVGYLRIKQGAYGSKSVRCPAFDCNKVLIESHTLLPKTDVNLSGANAETWESLDSAYITRHQLVPMRSVVCRVRQGRRSSRFLLGDTFCDRGLEDIYYINNLCAKYLLSRAAHLQTFSLTVEDPLLTACINRGALARKRDLLDKKIAVLHNLKYSTSEFSDMISGMVLYYSTILRTHIVFNMAGAHLQKAASVLTTVCEHIERWLQRESFYELQFNRIIRACKAAHVPSAYAFFRDLKRLCRSKSVNPSHAVALKKALEPKSYPWTRMVRSSLSTCPDEFTLAEKQWNSTIVKLWAKANY